MGAVAQTDLRNTYIPESVYWSDYYELSDTNYEWNNGYLEEKPVSDHLHYLIYKWFTLLLDSFLHVNPMAKMVGLEMGFRMALKNKVAIRKPDLGIVLNSNANPLELLDRSYKGTFDICIEAVSDSTKYEIEHDTVIKKAEYAQAGAKEYFILYAKEEMAFYRRDDLGKYYPIKPTNEGIIQSSVLKGFQFRVNDLFERPSLEKMSEDKVYQHFVLPAYQAEKQARLLAELQLTEEKRARQLAEDKIIYLEQLLKDKFN